MPKIKNLASGEIIEVSEAPVWIGGVWECGNRRFVDDSQSEFEIVIALPEPPKVSSVQFKLLFTAPERVAIKASTDDVVKDFFEIVNDPRLTFVDLGLESTKDAMAYLVSKSLLTQERDAEVLAGTLK